MQLKKLFVIKYTMSNKDNLNRLTSKKKAKKEQSNSRDKADTKTWRRENKVKNTLKTLRYTNNV